MKPQEISVLRINTTSIEDAIYTIWNFISDYNAEDPQRFRLADGRTFKWNPSLAHYYADHGRLTEEEFCLACEIHQTGITFSAS